MSRSRRCGSTPTSRGSGFRRKPRRSSRSTNVPRPPAASRCCSCSRAKARSTTSPCGRATRSPCPRPHNPSMSTATCGSYAAWEANSHENESRHLGPRADGHPLRPRRLPAAVARRADPRESAARRRRARRTDRRLRVPLPRGAEPREPRRRPRRARRARDLLHCVGAARRPALREGRSDVARRFRPLRGGAAVPRGGRSRRRGRRADDHLARRRGLQLSVPGAVRRGVVAPARRHRAGGRAPRAARAAPLPRAQELRAGDEDPHVERRHDAVRDLEAARTRHRQRQGQHGLAAPDHERREPGGVRRAARGAGPARPPARELGLGRVRRRQHGRGDALHGNPGARARAAARELRHERRAARLRPLSVHRGSGRVGAAVRAPVALHRRRCIAHRRVGAARGAVAQGRRARVRDRLRGARGVIAGVDVGTTAVKAVAIDADGNVLAREEESYELSTPQPGWAEQDPDDWVRAAERALPRVDATSVGFSGQMHGLVALGEDDVPLRPAILWNDQRTGAECAEIERRIGLERLIELTGNRAPSGFTAPKLLWLRAHEPDVYARIRSVLLPKDYVRLKLLGERAIDVADASGTLLFDVAQRRWSDEMLDALEVPRDWLPPVHESPAIAGAGDQAAGALGVGVAGPGPVSVVLGTSGVVFGVLERFEADPEARVHVFCHAVPGTWHAMGVMLSAAGSLQWLRDAVAPDAPFDELVDEAAKWPPSCEGLLFAPYLAGERTPH